MFSDNNINNYFNKSLTFVGNENFKLPSEAHKSSTWSIDKLQEMKSELNQVKGQLSNFNLDEWSKHTHSRDPSSFITSAIKAKGKVELLTQAWCKFYECLNRYPVVPEVAVAKNNFKSLHLCEAPGAFVSSLNHYVRLNHRDLLWVWFANTLNPYYEGNSRTEMICDNRLIRYTFKNWDFCLDHTGDITKFYNHRQLSEKYKVSLVTADGSVDCSSDPGEQENNVHYLHYCETMTALKVLEEGGTFVLKIFTMFEHGTICLLYLLNCVFKFVNVFKPCSSKSGNSEVYIVCLLYKGWNVLENLWESLTEPYRNDVQLNEVAMFKKEDIDSVFFAQIEECARYFMKMQIFTINNNISHFTNEYQINSDETEDVQREIAELFLEKYEIMFYLSRRYTLIKTRRKVQQPNKYVEWESKTTNLNTNINFEIQPTIGKALTKVKTSNFCVVTLKPNLNLLIDPQVIVTDVCRNLPSNYTLIQFSDFVHTNNQCEFQKEFFNILQDKFNKSNNLVIYSVPLLTRVLVGFIYILTICFNTIAVHNKTVLVLSNLNEERISNVKEYFSTIENFYNNLSKRNDFDVDILEIIPFKCLLDEYFYDIISRYNRGICEQ